MEWFEAIVGALGGSILGAIGSIFYFKPKLKEAKAEASKAETEASVAEYAHLLERINSMDEMFKKQGEVIDDLHNQLLKLKEEKYTCADKLMELERENERLTKRVDELAAEVEAYKVIANKK